MDDFYKDLIEQFLFESREILKKLENFFLSYHESLLPEIHRDVHTLKGNSGVIYSNLSDDFELKKNIFFMKEIIHKYEAILKALDAGTISFDKSLEELTFNIIDALNEIIDYTEDFKQVEKDYSELIKKIENFLSNIQKSEKAFKKEEIKEIETKKVSTEHRDDIEDFEEIDGKTFFDSIIEEGNTEAEKNKEQLDTYSSDMTKKGTEFQLDRFLKKEDFKIIQVKTQKIDRMLSYVSELTNLKNVFDYIFEKNKNKIDIELKNALQRLRSISDEIQKNVLNLRLFPVKEIFQKFPRIVNEYAKMFNKKISITIKGEDIEIDKTILTELNDILVHIVRNAIDHGIESPEERKIVGKNETGKILIQAGIEKEYFKLIVADDGRGINPSVIKESVVNKGLMTYEEVNELNENQIMQLIFLPGFSTKKEVSEISGRGVGLDVVKETVKKLNGRIEVYSELNKGTIFRIYLPISLNIIKTLIVKLCGYNFSIPYSDVNNTIVVSKKDIKEIMNKFIFVYENKKIQLFDLGVLLGYRNDFLESKFYEVVIIKIGDELFGFVVDELLDEQEIVVYQLPDFVTLIPGISGATILGNGEISVVLNLKDLLI